MILDQLIIGLNNVDYQLQFLAIPNLTINLAIIFLLMMSKSQNNVENHKDSKNKCGLTTNMLSLL